MVQDTVTDVVFIDVNVTYNGTLKSRIYVLMLSSCTVSYIPSPLTMPIAGPITIDGVESELSQYLTSPGCCSTGRISALLDAATPKRVSEVVDIRYPVLDLKALRGNIQVTDTWFTPDCLALRFVGAISVW